MANVGPMDFDGLAINAGINAVLTPFVTQKPKVNEMKMLKNKKTFTAKHLSLKLSGSKGYGGRSELLEGSFITAQCNKSSCGGLNVYTNGAGAAIDAKWRAPNPPLNQGAPSSSKPPFNTNPTTCYICGCPINQTGGDACNYKPGLASYMKSPLKNKCAKPPNPDYTMAPCRLGSPFGFQCEHVLPVVTLAFVCGLSTDKFDQLVGKIFEEKYTGTHTAQIEEYREQLKRIRKRMFQTGIGGADIDDGVYGYPEDRGYEGGGPKGILYKYAHPACNMIKDEAAFYNIIFKDKGPMGLDININNIIRNLLQLIYSGTKDNSPAVCWRSKVEESTGKGAGNNLINRVWVKDYAKQLLDSLIQNYKKPESDGIPAGNPGDGLDKIGPVTRPDGTPLINQSMVDQLVITRLAIDCSKTPAERVWTSKWIKYRVWRIIFFTIDPIHKNLAQDLLTPEPGYGPLEAEGPNAKRIGTGGNNVYFLPVDNAKGETLHNWDDATSSWSINANTDENPLNRITTTGQLNAYKQDTNQILPALGLELTLLTIFSKAKKAIEKYNKSASRKNKWKA